MELQIVAKPPEGCNNNNEHAWTPILPTKPLTVDTKWFERQPAWIRDSFSKTFPDAVFGDVELPHTGPECETSEKYSENPQAVAFYKWWLSLYAFENFISLIPDAICIPLSAAATDELRDLCQIGVLQPGKRPYLEDSPFLERETFGPITEFLKHCEARSVGAFVKTMQKSGKNNVKLTESFTVEDVFNNLVHSTDVLHSLGKVTALVLRPWDKAISRQTEFRAFVQGRKLLAVAQQAWHTPLVAMPDVEGLLAAINDLLPTLPYSDCVLDLHWHDGRLTLIEINPGGRWHSSGASLFRWEEIVGERSGVLVRLRIEM